jgi:putative lysine transport system substrate-binding protein
MAEPAGRGTNLIAALVRRINQDCYSKEGNVMRTKQVFSALMALVCGAALLSACGSSGTSSAASASSAAAAAGSSQAAAESTGTAASDGTAGEAGTTSSGANGTLRVGMSADYAPFDWLQNDDSNGAVKTTNGSYINGYDVMMAKQVTSELGMNLEITQVDWNGLIMAITSDKVDCAIAGMSITSERKKSVDFTDWYYQANTALVVNKDSKYAGAKSLKDLAGGKFTSAQNTTWYAALDQLDGIATKGAALQTFAALVSAVHSGIVDGFTCDVPSAESLLKTNPDLLIVKFDEGKGFQDKDEDVNLGIAVKKGNTELVDKINGVLEKMTDDDRDQMMKEAVAAEPANSIS